MSVKKSIKERFEGKVVRMLSGLDGNVCGTSESPEEIAVTVCTQEGTNQITLAVSNIEARGGKFYEKTKSEEGVSMSGEAKVLENNAVDETPQTVSATLACQFCSHLFANDGSGFTKPEQKADVCPACVDLAAERLLASGLPEEAVNNDSVIEFLARFYGFVTENLNIVISYTGVDKTPCTESTVEAAKEVASETGDLGDAEKRNSVEEFLYARREIANTLIRLINTVTSDSAEVVMETPESIIIRFDPFDFELTALCGGYILSVQEETGDTVREEEFTALDELFSYFCGESESEEDADADDVEELQHLPIDGFYRLQNCKNEENNKKLVKILDVIMPETEGAEIVYRVIDKTGKTYKVSESKLKTSNKTF